MTGVMAGSTQRDQADLYLKQMAAFGIADIDTGSVNVPGVFNARGNPLAPSNLASVLMLSVGVGVGLYLANKYFKII